MRRPRQIVLVLMGGGLVLSGCDSRDCREARAQHRADADQLCRQSASGHGGSSGGGFWSRTSRSSAASGGEASGSSRGGFGGAGHGAAGE